MSASNDIPLAVPLPLAAEEHYRAFAWVVHEQRLMALLLGWLAAATGMVWLLALALEDKPPILVRAAPSLRESAAAFAGAPDLAYDQVAFFLQACVPLLFATEQGRHPWLPLAEGLAAPDLCREAERRLDAHAAEMTARSLSQSLTLTGIDSVVADQETGRAAANLTGVLRVISAAGSVRAYTWHARAVLAANPGGRLNPYPFYLLTLESEAVS